MLSGIKMKSSIILLVYLAFNLLSYTETSHVYECNSHREPCTLQDVVLESENALDQVTFPNINGSLVIDSGKIPNFSRKLAEKLVGIVDLIINSLEMETLYIKPEMTHLEAKNNQIETLLVDSSKTYKMMSLDLTGNRLSNVTMLLGFTNLRYLTLDQNNLDRLSMDVFTNMSELRKLSLARNQLFTVNTEKTLQLLKLQSLSLAWNKLVELNIEKWELDSLTSLDLSNNQLYLLDGSLEQFKTLVHVKISENYWKCEFLVQINQMERLVLDHDAGDRCSNKGWPEVNQVCCTSDASDVLGNDTELFQDKWEELRKLNETVEQFKTATEQNQQRIEELEENSKNTQRIKQLEDEQQTFLAKLNDQKESVAVQEINELKKVITFHKLTYEEINLKQSDLESKLENLVKILDEKSKAVDEVKAKLENKAVDNNVENVEKTITKLSDKFKHLERQQLQYFLSTVDLKNQIVTQRPKISEIQENYSKLQAEYQHLSADMENLWSKIEHILYVLRDMA